MGIEITLPLAHSPWTRSITSSLAAAGRLSLGAQLSFFLENRWVGEQET